MNRIWPSAAALVLGGCQLLLGFDEFEAAAMPEDAAMDVLDGGALDGGAPDAGGTRAGGATDAGEETPSEPDAAPGPDASPDGGEPADAAPDASLSGCALHDTLADRIAQGQAAALPEDGRGELVAVTREDGTCFLIQRLEVSVEAYLSARDAIEALPDDSACGWKSALSTPADGSCGDFEPVAEAPITCIDFCDAREYCRSQGLSLCRGEFPSEAQVDPQRSDWYAACSNGGKRVFPYGDRYDATLCNGEGNPMSDCPDACAASPVAANPSCSAASGALNLSGNVAEWTAACRDETGPDDPCRVRGGSYRSPAAALQCEGLQAPSRDTRRVDIGARCCFYGD